MDSEKNEKLWDAVRENDARNALFWIEEGADINMGSDGPSGITPLMYASIYHCMDVLEVLIEKGANLETTSNQGGYTVLMSVSIDELSSMEAVDASKNTALSFSIKQNSLDVAYLLLSRMTPDELNNEINLQPDLNIPIYLGNLKQRVVTQYLKIFKKVEFLTDQNIKNPFSVLPAEIAVKIVATYCALQKKSEWRVHNIKLDTNVICDVFNKTLIFSRTAVENTKNKNDASILCEEIVKNLQKIKI